MSGTRFAVMLIFLTGSACDALKCRCNRLYNYAYNQQAAHVNGGGDLQTAITGCDNTMTCEIQEDVCESNTACAGILNASLETGQRLRPACLYEVNGIQGCHWFSGITDYACDQTRGPFRNTDYNYRCMSGDYCNDKTLEAVNDECEAYNRNKRRAAAAAHRFK